MQINQQKQIADLLKTIISEHFSGEGEAFAVAGDEYVALALAGKNPKSLEKRAAVNNEFGESVIPVMKFVVLTWQTVKVFLEVYALLGARGEPDVNELAVRWRAELTAAGLDPSTAEKIAKQHTLELKRIVTDNR